MSDQQVISKTAAQGMGLVMDDVAEVIARACPPPAYQGKRVLLIIPDGTRTAPVGLVFKALHARLGSVVARLDVMVALGTHQPMSEEAICHRLEITLEERKDTYHHIQFYNHEWNNPRALREIGSIPAETIHQLTDGLFSMEVPVEINRQVFDYDQVIIVGPVFPHEVVGFSGGNKYLFPGVGGSKILNCTSLIWLSFIRTSIAPSPSTRAR